MIYCNIAILIYLILVSLANTCLGQTTITLLSIQITFTNRGSQTDFVVTSSLGGGVTPSNAWLGVGFNSMSIMDGASVVMCLNSPSISQVQHYYNNGKNSIVLDQSNPTLGITNGRITASQGNLICEFTRDNSNANPNYFNINANNPYIIVAFGNLVATSVGYHSQRLASSTRTSFPVVAVTTTTTLATTTTTTLRTSTSTSTSRTTATTTTSTSTTTAAFTTTTTSTTTRVTLTTSSTSLSPLLTTSSTSQNPFFSRVCEPNPCKNSGKCIPSSLTTAYCECQSFFTGYTCELVNPCSNYPCRNGGLCTVTSMSGPIAQFKCTCRSGYTGSTCQVNLRSSCTTSTCFNGGTCFIDNTLATRCNCPPFYTGTYCEQFFNPCVSSATGLSPCLNSATCLTNFGVPPYYQCLCRTGYYGTNCQFELPFIIQTSTSTTTTTAVPRTTQIGIISCQDTQQNCQIWATLKLCERLINLNPHPCRKSCQICF